MSEPRLIDIIQLHERKWGEQQYYGRPSLATLMVAPIVAVWKTDNRFMLSAHREADELNDIVTAIIVGKEPNPHNRKLIRIFANHRLVPFTLRIVAIPESQPASADSNRHPTQEASDAKSHPYISAPKSTKIVGSPAPRTKPIVSSTWVEPIGTPAFLEPIPLDKSNDTSLPGRHVSLLVGRQVELLPGREVPVVKTVSGTKPK
jgi:hypothetical protein